MKLTPYLEQAEAAIDPAWEDRKLDHWRRLLDFEPLRGGFPACLGAPKPGTATETWPKVLTNEAIRSPEKMLLQQFRSVWLTARDRQWSIPNVRSNFGTGILPSLFGAETFWMEDAQDTLPTNRPLGPAAMDALLARGVPDLNAGFGARVFEYAQFFREQIAPYPKLRKYVWFYHPDLQGPIDVLELLWGSDLFYAVVDQPEKVKAVLELIVETYERFLRRWLKENPPKGDGRYMAHWGLLVKGQVFLRNDSVMNLSRAAYEEFVRPYDERLLQTFGGGGIHFCGKADHVVPGMTESRRVTMIQMSQPHLNDMAKIVDATLGRGVSLCSKYVDSMSACDLSRGYMRYG